MTTSPTVLRKPAFFLAILCGPVLPAAEVPPPPAVIPAPASEEKIIELSPFEVRADTDVGYQAINTTSGSRLNSRLKDTAASVSPFTGEFLSDLAATNLQEMLGYANNVEAEFEDATAGFNNPPGRDATGNTYQFRMRGMASGAARDFVESSVPVDLYNVERAEVTGGPNSILFGLGSAGGTVTLTGKRAALNRSRASIKTQFGTYHYQRYEIDDNLVLRPQRLAVRVLGVYQDSEGWRKWDLNEQKRLTGAVTFQPFRNTTLRFSAETGQTANNVQVALNGTDQISGWLAAGQPVADGVAITGTTRLATGTNRFTFFDRDGLTYNLKGELQTAGAQSAATLLSPSMSPYNYNVTGPGGLRSQKIDSRSAQFEQRLARNLTLELAYFHNRARVTASGMEIVNGTIALRADPNLTLPAIDGSSATVPNTRARQWLMESTWFRDRVTTTNDVYRASLAYEKSLGPWFGRHRLAGLIENSQQERLRRWGNESLVDENNVPSGNAATPDGNGNQLTRRHYVTEGDWANYYCSDPRIAVPEFVSGGRRFHSTYISRQKANTHTVKDADAFMLATQSFWWNDRIVATAGTRVDRITFKNADEARVTNPNDPRVVSRQIVLNEFDFSGTDTVNRYTPRTITAGAVFHAHPRLSFFYNQSDNIGTPRFDRTVLPNGDVPPPMTGKGRDYGIMIDLFGDDRYFLRAARYTTAQINDAPIIPDGQTVNTSGALGGDNLLAILNALLNAGKITRDQFDAQAVYYNAATIDLFTNGYEVEFVANPTKNLTCRLGYTYSQRWRGNFFKEIFAFYEPKYPEWRRLAGSDAALLTTINNEIATLQSDLDAQITRQNSPFGTRPHKGNATARYRFSTGRLKGLFVGGGARYQSRQFISRNAATGQDYWGNEMLFVDAFAGYRVRLPYFQNPLSLQLNVRNLSNSYLVNIGRYNTDYTGIARVYLNEPRTYRLTATFEF